MRSEQVLQAELNLPRRCRRRGDPSERRRHVAGHVGKHDAPGRNREVRPIEEVKGFEADLQRTVRRELESLDERHIRIDQSGAGQRIARHVAACVRRRHRERVDVQVPIGTANDRIAGEPRIPVRALVHREAGRVQIAGAIEAEANRERLSALNRRHIVQLPAFQQARGEGRPSSS